MQQLKNEVNLHVSDICQVFMSFLYLFWLSSLQTQFLFERNSPVTRQEYLQIYPMTHPSPMCPCMGPEKIFSMPKSLIFGGDISIHSIQKQVLELASQQVLSKCYLFLLPIYMETYSINQNNCTGECETQTFCKTAL